MVLFGAYSFQELESNHLSVVWRDDTTLTEMLPGWFEGDGKSLLVMQ